MTHDRVIASIILVLAFTATITYITTPSQYATTHTLKLVIPEDMVYKRIIGAEPRQTGSLKVEYATLHIPGYGFVLPTKTYLLGREVIVEFTYPKNLAHTGLRERLPVITVSLSDYKLGYTVNLIFRSSSIEALDYLPGDTSEIDDARIRESIRDALAQLNNTPNRVLLKDRIELDVRLLAILAYRSDLAVKTIEVTPSTPRLDGLRWTPVCGGAARVEHAVDYGSQDAGSPTPDWWRERVSTRDKAAEDASWALFRDRLIAGVYRVAPGSNLSKALECISRYALLTRPSQPISIIAMDDYIAAAAGNASWLDHIDLTGARVFTGHAPIFNYTVYNTLDTLERARLLGLETSIFIVGSTSGVSGLVFDGLMVSLGEWPALESRSLSVSDSVHSHSFHYLLPVSIEYGKDVLIVKWSLYSSGDGYIYVRPKPLLTPLYSASILGLKPVTTRYHMPDDLPSYRIRDANVLSWNTTIRPEDIKGTPDKILQVTINSPLGNHIAPTAPATIAAPITSPLLESLPDGEHGVETLREVAATLGQTVYVKAANNNVIVTIIFAVYADLKPSTAYRFSLECSIPPVIVEMPRTSSLEPNTIECVQWTGLVLGLEDVGDTTG